MYSFVVSRWDDDYKNRIWQLVNSAWMQTWTPLFSWFTWRYWICCWGWDIIYAMFTDWQLLLLLLSQDVTSLIWRRHNNSWYCLVFLSYNNCCITFLVFMILYILKDILWNILLYNFCLVCTLHRLWFMVIVPVFHF